jgi:predicted dehydrogenase
MSGATSPRSPEATAEWRSPPRIRIHGCASDGTLLVHQPKAAREGEKVGAGRIELVTGKGSEWIEPPALPDDERDAPSYFLSRLAAGRPIEGLCAPEIGPDAQEIIDAALRSSASGREVKLPLSRG